MKQQQLSSGATQTRCTTTLPALELPNIPLGAVEERLSGRVSNHENTIKTLTEMPGPKCYPLIGSLMEYLPGGELFLEMFQNNENF